MNNPPLDSALWWLSTSNVLYVTGAVLTVLTAAWVVYETRAVALGKHPKFFLLSEIFAAVAATICLAGTIGAIHFGNLVGHLKDLQLDTYKTDAGKQIAKAQKDAADANKATADLALKNTQLQIELSSHETLEKKAEAKLTAKETLDYNNVLAQQKAASQQSMVMAQQAKLSPVLDDLQISALGNSLKSFAGQDVILHSTADTTVLRSKVSIIRAFQIAGITFKENSMDMGQMYQGISVVVHSPQDVPPLANALTLALRAAGITVNTVSAEFVPAGRVAIYFGPN